ncbi:hypothetical protein QA601_13915 [Chitinispirillales bacterium ANBcel5]|uniref:hypothetical protein n=1 Tax=Cellulosispirillum alkaliphilum TaxID=3039283 RepID=UPI002A54CB1E|nr:hypothetical protein [Chitinispirillales bacterium ANBcel5]
MKKTICLITAALIVFSATVKTQNHLTKINGSEPKPESMAFLPGSERVKPFFLGFHDTFAHYLWIRTVLYFGAQHQTDRDYAWLIQKLDIITRLHPHFFPAYEFAGLLVPEVCNNPDAARVIMERGMIHLSQERWQIPFYLGMLYFRYYDDPDRAAEYFTIATQVPGAPSEKLGTLAASFYQRSGRKETGVALLYFLYETADSPEVKRHIEERLVTLLEE